MSILRAASHRLFGVTIAVVIAAGGGCASKLWSCDNGVQDGRETGPDCGGPDCPACAIGMSCQVSSDCASARCDLTMCMPAATCGDGILDGSETDVDCGGSCSRCAPGRHCTQSSDCTSALCEVGLCGAAPSCSDGRRDGSETDVDCGGNCPGCAAGSSCNGDSDCADYICESGTCRSTTCADKLKDGDETDVDCGGGTCPQCMTGGICLVPTDCESSICTAGRCSMIMAPCGPGYALDNSGDCLCDPQSCGSCCNVDEGDVCGLTNMPGGNNCGTIYQQCFLCDITRGESCEHSTKDADYCAVACNVAQCGGCCSGPEEQLEMFCLHGDEDFACGTGGAKCQVCGNGQHCSAGSCVN